MNEPQNNMDAAKPQNAKTIGIKGRRRWQIWAVEIAIIIVVVAGVRVWQQRHMVNGPAPELNGILLSGEAYQLAASSPKPVMVHFWATWCPVCKAEQGAISEIAKDHAIITIALWSNDVSEIQKYVAEHKLEYPVIFDADGSVAKNWGVSAVPASFIVDKDGNIRFREVGYTTEWGMRLRLWFAGL